MARRKGTRSAAVSKDGCRSAVLSLRAQVMACRPARPVPATFAGKGAGGAHRMRVTHVAAADSAFPAVGPPYDDGWHSTRGVVYDSVT